MQGVQWIIYLNFWMDEGQFSFKDWHIHFSASFCSFWEILTATADSRGLLSGSSFFIFWRLGCDLKLSPPQGWGILNLSEKPVSEPHHPLSEKS